MAIASPPVSRLRSASSAEAARTQAVSPCRLTHRRPHARSSHSNSSLHHQIHNNQPRHQLILQYGTDPKNKWIPINQDNQDKTALSAHSLALSTLALILPNLAPRIGLPHVLRRHLPRPQPRHPLRATQHIRQIVPPVPQCERVRRWRPVTEALVRRMPYLHVHSSKPLPISKHCSSHIMHDTSTSHLLYRRKVQQ